MTTYYTAASAAEALGCSPSTISRHCRTHGIGGRHGGTLLLDDDDLDRLRGLVRPGPGCPLFGTAEMAARGAAAKKARKLKENAARKKSRKTSRISS